MSVHVHGFLHGLMKVLVVVVLIVFVLLNPFRTVRLGYRVVNAFVGMAENVASGRYIR